MEPSKTATRKISQSVPLATRCYTIRHETRTLRFVGGTAPDENITGCILSAIASGDQVILHHGHTKKA